MIKYLDRYKDPNMGSHWRVQAKPTQFAFIYYLMFQMHFIEDWRDALLRYFYKIIRKDRPQSKLGSELSQQRSKDIEDIIKNCIGRELIQYSKPTYNAGLSNTQIWTDNKSREFLQPLRFFNAILKEYGYFASFVFGVGGTLLITFWNNIIPFIQEQIVKLIQ